MNEIVGYSPMVWAEDEYGWHVQLSTKPEAGEPVTSTDLFNFIHNEKDISGDNGVA